MSQPSLLISVQEKALSNGRTSKLCVQMDFRAHSTMKLGRPGGTRTARCLCEVEEALLLSLLCTTDHLRPLPVTCWTEFTLHHVTWRGARGKQIRHLTDLGLGVALELALWPPLGPVLGATLYLVPDRVTEVLDPTVSEKFSFVSPSTSHLVNHQPNYRGEFKNSFS